MQYKRELLECINVLGRCRMSAIKSWYTDRGRSLPADITIHKHLATLLSEGKIERAGLGLYCALGKSPEAPPVAPWIVDTIKRRYPDYWVATQLRSLYAKTFGVKLEVETFTRALTELVATGVLEHFQSRAYGWIIPR